jgi:hypothetical protein
MVDRLYDSGLESIICTIILRLQELYVYRKEVMEKHKANKTMHKYAKPCEFPNHPEFKAKIRYAI